MRVARGERPMASVTWRVENPGPLASRFGDRLIGLVQGCGTPTYAGERPEAHPQRLVQDRIDTGNGCGRRETPRLISSMVTRTAAARGAIFSRWSKIATEWDLGFDHCLPGNVAADGTGRVLHGAYRQAAHSTESRMR